MTLLCEVMNPRESGAFIAANSKDVSILMENIEPAAQQIYDSMKKKHYSKAKWKEWPLHPKVLSPETVDWIFVVDTLNFSFWLPGEKKFQLEYHNIIYEDYEALCAGINRAIEEGIHITTPSFYKNISLETIKHVFRSCNGTELPLLEERTNNLREAGEILSSTYNNSFSNFLLKCDQDVTKVIEMVTKNFPSYRDIGIFEDRKVSFYKRVQILIADIWACFEGETFGKFKNIEKITMFADYRVPQALLAYGVISYSENLMRLLQNGDTLNMHSREEMEIRGCSIHVVELLRRSISNIIQHEKSFTAKILDINAVMVDFYLWDFATQNPEKVNEFPEHRTRSTFY
ncbi:queuosine 5'-phosphate N-glycosylase/hydrolase isoform X1 [Hydra vulgaris]|uniref:queuosine 5'-phosphate N-glycosylase/hydrolase isoform X1 n=2 Tax=Hydra vulgaris TaxID=6087 RepID=UPI001F5F4433|nr:queuosine salvage protein [Hydra vulgaris]